MKIIYHGHSFIELHVSAESKQYHILIDPFITYNGLCDVKPEDVRCDYIILSHGHQDHYGDTEDLAKRNKATVIAPFELAEYVGKKEIKAHPMAQGGCFTFPFGKVKLTIAHHSSSTPDGAYAGNPAGILLYTEGKTIYHSGDTALFYDMKLIGESNSIDHAFLPIGDNFTMGIDDAVKAMEFINAAKVTPIHYNTFDEIKSDPDEFKKKIEAIGKECVVMKPGDEITL
jgi:L-ascorbate metabolism protein UlaG (beta-lactamase superfamily)